MAQEFKIFTVLKIKFFV